MDVGYVEDCTNCSHIGYCKYCGREFCNQDYVDVCHRRRCMMQCKEEGGDDYFEYFW
jgi:hypothetical protein